MQILSVTLKNFKVHRDKHVTFAPGTNAICGENGAGKTSILEAIAWVLFTYQGDYTRDDLIRNGSGSASVTVEFISNQDGRTYAVQRHTTRGYTIFDPQLNARLPYTRLKDEVLPWLREHLGVAPGTDLAELFARTIGVPQGTFTADFLQPPETRKSVFDKVLKVEEYKALHRDLNSLRRYAEAQVEALDRDIAHYEERLADWESLQTRHQTVAAELADSEAHLQRLTEQLQALTAERDRLKAQAAQVQTLQTQHQQVEAEVAQHQQTIAWLAESLAQAQQAADLCASTRPAYEAYRAAEAELEALNQQQTQRYSLQMRQQQLQTTLATGAADMARLKAQLDNFEAAAAEIEQLRPQMEQQTQLEAELTQLQQQQRSLAQTRGEYQATEQQRSLLASQINPLRQEIDQLQALATTLADGDALTAERDRLQQQLYHLEAAQQFEAELQQLVSRGQAATDDYRAQVATALDYLATGQQQVPDTAIAPLKRALETGIQVNQTLLSQVQQILRDLSAQTDADDLRSRLSQVQQRWAAWSQQQAKVALLPERQQQLTRLLAQEADLQERLQRLQGQLDQAATVTAQLDAVQSTLATLADPKGRCAHLARSYSQQATVQQHYDQRQAAQMKLQQQIDQVTAQLDACGDLAAAIATVTQQKQLHQEGYQQYLQHERAAQTVAPLQQQHTAAEQALAQHRQRQAQLAAALAAARAKFDAERAQQVETEYEAVRSQADRLAGRLPQQRHLLEELQRQLAALQDLAQHREAALQERRQRDRVRRFVNFARKAYKTAGPRITERYVQQISREADRLFRELLNRPNVALDWTPDYEICVQEGPNRRRFVNLSGGEQMCAALAVRLALLKVLADIDIAFFDEPTTNMDRLRRDSLAEAIARIRSFSQLFVISHDDTFEKVTETVIFIERDAEA